MEISFLTISNNICIHNKKIRKIKQILRPSYDQLITKAIIYTTKFNKIVLTLLENINWTQWGL